MTVRIEQKIKGFSVAPTQAPAPETPPAAPPVEAVSNVVHMHETLERPELLNGSTLKLKSAVLDHALYLTINHIVLNEGTEHEIVRPFELFINTKDPKSQPWIVALTRMISAAWRKGGDFAFVIDELKAVHDPNGGCYLPGGTYVPSVVAHIGLTLERHLQNIGALRRPELSPELKEMIEAKTQQLQEREEAQQAPQSAPATSESIKGGTMCSKCNNMSVVIMDGCATCLECGYSKCG